MKLAPMEGELRSSLACERIDSNCTARGATADMILNWLLIIESELNSHMEDIYGNFPQTPLNSGHRFWE
jgi:hypothetical protein